MARLKTSHKVGGAAFAATIALAVPCVAQFEGLWLSAKPDTLAHGIPTVCYGETEGVKVGDRYTKEQCQQMLALKLPRYLDEIDRCIHVPIADRTRASLLSFAYNVGSGGFCKSQAARLLNAGKDAAACEALRPWNRAGGQVRKGLVHRRSKEVAMCRVGLNDEKHYIGAKNVVQVVTAAEDINPVIKAEPKPVLKPKKPWWKLFS